MNFINLPDFIKSIDYKYTDIKYIYNEGGEIEIHFYFNFRPEVRDLSEEDREDLISEIKDKFRNFVKNDWGFKESSVYFDNGFTIVITIDTSSDTWIDEAVENAVKGEVKTLINFANNITS